jgi:hypothetical protein
MLQLSFVGGLTSRYVDFSTAQEAALRMLAERAGKPVTDARAGEMVHRMDSRLVAAHSWDISGALADGCQAASVARPGMVLSPIGAQPDITGPDIAAVVEQIVAADAR